MPHENSRDNGLGNKKLNLYLILTLLVPGGFGSKISRGGGQFDPGFYFKLLTPKIGVLTILVYSIVKWSTNA